MLLRPFERFLYAPDDESGAEDDALSGPTEPSDDDGAPVEGEAAEPTAEADPEPADDDDGGDDEEPVAAAPATFDHGIEGVPTTAAEFKTWHDQQQAEQARLKQQHDAYQNQLLWLSHQMQQQAAAQHQAQQAAQQKPPEAWKNPLGELPEFRQEWLQLVERDENGNLVARPGAMPDLPQKIASYQRAREEAIDKMLRDPGSVLKSFVEHNGYLTREQAQQQFAQMLDQRDESAYLEKLRTEATWAFDANGQLNQLGQRWDSYYKYLRNAGVPYREAARLADDGVNSHAFMAGLQNQQQAPAQAPAKPAPTAAEKRSEVRRATNPPSRSGTLPKSAGRNRLNGSLNIKQALKAGYSNLSDSDFSE